MSSASSSIDLSPAEFSLFQRFLGETIGLYYDERRKPLIEAALRKRMDDLKITSFIEYYQLVSSNTIASIEQGELKHLLILLTIGETAFFRSPDQFRALKEYVLPHLCAKKSAFGKTLRIWSAGCSTGEEPYSLAITVLETIGDTAVWDIKIMASDINLRFLERAQKGVYSRRSLRFVEADVGRHVLDKYFIHDRGKYTISEDVRHLVTFFPHNLVRDPYNVVTQDGIPLDIIFCRNVLIYFDRDATKEVVTKYHSLLQDEGYLFLGYSESLFQLTQLFKIESWGEAFFYTKQRKMRKAVVPEQHRTLPTSILLPFPAPQTQARASGPDVASGQAPLPDAAAREGYAEAIEYLKADDYDSGIHILRELAEDSQRDPLVILSLGNACLDKSNIEEAIEIYHRALDIEPLSEEGHFLLALALWKGGRTDDALKELKKALFIDKDFALSLIHI